MNIKYFYVVITGNKKENIDHVSSEAYSDIETAVSFIERRSDKPLT